MRQLNGVRILDVRALLTIGDHKGKMAAIKGEIYDRNTD